MRIIIFSWQSRSLDIIYKKTDIIHLYDGEPNCLAKPTSVAGLILQNRTRVTLWFSGLQSRMGLADEFHLVSGLLRDPRHFFFGFRHTTTKEEGDAPQKNHKLLMGRNPEDFCIYGPLHQILVQFPHTLKTWPVHPKKHLLAITCSWYGKWWTFRGDSRRS